MSDDKMATVTGLNTGFKPEIQPVENVKLPLELRNFQGEVIASIWYWEEKRTYHGTVNHRDVAVSRDFSDCLTQTFGWLYQEMQDFRKVAEKHRRLTEALRESLKTPFNDL